ncbi:MAG: hypothetical protein AAF715_00120 [Myxococcota bacterium]
MNEPPSGGPSPPPGASPGPTVAEEPSPEALLGAAPTEFGDALAPAPRPDAAPTAVGHAAPPPPVTGSPPGAGFGSPTPAGSPGTFGGTPSPGFGGGPPAGAPGTFGGTPSPGFGGSLPTAPGAFGAAPAPAYGPPPYGAPPPGPYPPGYGPPGHPGGYGAPPPPKSGNGALWIVGLIVGLVVVCGVVTAIGAAGARKYAEESIERERDRMADDRDDDDERRAETMSTDDDGGMRGRGSRGRYRAPDGTGQVRLPKGWAAIPDLNDEASIQVGNALREEYLIVLSESREDFGPAFDLEKFAEVCLEGMGNNIGDLERGRFEETKIGGRDALLVEVRAVVDNLNVVYLVGYIEGAEMYHQLLTWTLKSKFNQNEGRLRGAIESFRELRPPRTP